MGQLFFDAESIYEISKPYLELVTDGRMHGRTSPKQYAPWGIKQSSEKEIQYIF